MNNDNVANGQMSTSHRMNIYGASLPPPALAGNSAGVILQFICVWNVIPTPLFADLLPLDYNMHEQSLDLLDISKFVPTSGLSSFKNAEIGKLERMMELPQTIRNKALEDFIHTKKHSTNSKYRNVLDVLDPLVGENIARPIVVDKSFLEEFTVSASKKRREGVRNMNNVNSNMQY